MSGTYNRKDHFYQRAKDEGYRSRAAYKLIDLDKKYKFLKPGSAIVDLGCFPGGWLQVALEKVGRQGVVAGVDRVFVEPVASSDNREAIIIEGDFLESQTQQLVSQAIGGEADVVLSDLSPKLSGVRFRDVAACVELVDAAFLFCCEVLKEGGTFVAKIFPGSDADEFYEKLKDCFVKLQRERSTATRKSSNEYYIVGSGFRRQETKSKLNQAQECFPEWSPV